ncbi:MAG: thermonuclease family protein [Pseudanabaena sp. M051S1SP2A07QC]|nr:thermonuclease family protein [Pseudanabaena sp. M051S1SP2A07QC]
MRKIFDTAIEISIIVAAIALFMHHRNEQEMSKRPSYEGNEAAIARPIRSEDTQYKICQTTKVSDGDTIAVDCDGEKLKLRFCGIDAPESKQQLGAESKALLSKLVEGKQVIVRPMEQDRYDRTVAEVSVKVGNDEYAHNVNTEMVKSGMAYHYKQYSSNCPSREAIAIAEDEAKSNKIGVWSGDYQKPWEYRKKNK